MSASEYRIGRPPAPHSREQGLRALGDPIMSATTIVTTSDMCHLDRVFRGIRAARTKRRPTVHVLARVGSLETFQELTLAQTRERLQTERLRLFCLGNVPTRRGQPNTTITDPDDISQIIAEQAQ
jgi:hypothetical protein